MYTIQKLVFILFIPSIGLLTAVGSTVPIKHKEKNIISDTTNLKVRIRANPPGIDGASKAISNYGLRVYAYNYVNSKLIKYQVNKFNLVYIEKETINVMESFGNTNVLTSEMKKFISNLDTAAYQNLFLENISITDSIGKKIFVKGPQKAAIFENEE